MNFPKSNKHIPKLLFFFEELLHKNRTKHVFFISLGQKACASNMNHGLVPPTKKNSNLYKNCTKNPFDIMILIWPRV